MVKRESDTGEQNS